jgi:hypothetical protein
MDLLEVSVDRLLELFVLSVDFVSATTRQTLATLTSFFNAVMASIFF